jgi:nucleoside-diphosphate-sugar epimerase
MKVLVAGASGAIGRVLLPLLEAAGHEVVGWARSPRSGPPPVLAVDALDRVAVATAVRASAPDAIGTSRSGVDRRARTRPLWRLSGSWRP